MIYLAYDGSVNGDWIARYAIRMAANSREKQLRVLSVDDSHFSEADYLAKVERLDRECRAAGVACNAVRLPLQGSVAESLIAAIEPGADQLLVCGARVRSRDRGYFSGTVSNELMRWRRCNVVALRVVQPGLLGNARSALIPVGGSETGLKAIGAFLERLIPGIERIELLRVVEIASWRFRRISPETARRARRAGIQRVYDAEKALRDAIDLTDIAVDTAAVVSDDWPKQVVISASRHKSQLIMIEAAKRDLRQRFVFGNRLEEVLRDAPCDVVIYRGAET